jgi:hypothetical protein
MGDVEVQVHTLILALDTQRVAALLLQPLHPKYHMNLKLGPQRHPQCCGNHKNLFPSEFEPQFFGHAAQSPDATMTDLSQLPSSLLLPSVQHSPS